MAQFSHPDFGGMSQWSPGMTMVGDMFNNSLKSKLDAVCTELAAYVAHTPSTDQDRGREGGEVSYHTSRQRSDWWPMNLGTPSAVGAQNNLQYAVFPGTRRLAIEARLAEAPADTSDVHPNIAEHYRAKVIHLAETLAEPESNGEAREDIRSLIGEVVITPGEKRGESHATLRGELMAILDLAAGRRRSPRPEVITNVLASPRNHFHYNSLTVPV
jgi:hypothetical protein